MRTCVRGQTSNWPHMHTRQTHIASPAHLCKHCRVCARASCIVRTTRMPRPRRISRANEPDRSGSRPKEHPSPHRVHTHTHTNSTHRQSAHSFRSANSALRIRSHFAAQLPAIEIETEPIQRRNEKKAPPHRPTRWPASSCCWRRSAPT